MLIIYSGNGEVLVCSRRAEVTLLKEWFDESGRNVEEYDREEIKEGIASFKSSISVR